MASSQEQSLHRLLHDAFSRGNGQWGYPFWHRLSNILEPRSLEFSFTVVHGMGDSRLRMTCSPGTQKSDSLEARICFADPD